MGRFIYKPELTPYAWWYVSEKIFNGKVLIIGSIYKEDLLLISSMARRVVCADNSIDYINNLDNVEYVEIDKLNNTHFDIIIENAFNNTGSEINDAFSKIKTLTWSVCVCFYKNDFYLGNYNKGYLKRIFNRNKTQYRQYDKNEIIYSMAYPCISYENNPVEAYFPGRYESNKNVFYFKEKIKKIIFNASLNRFFINGVISIKTTIDSSGLFYNKILKELSSLINCHYDSLCLTNIFYKFGKVILSISSDKSGDYIVVVAFDELARLQRDNEYKTIKALKNIDAISKYIPDQYYSLNVNGVYCYIMSKINGITVDKSSRHLNKMTLNAFSVIIEITRSTINYDNPISLKKILIKEYIDAFKNKFENHVSIPGIDLNKITGELSGLPDVLMHGDSKLENYVLDEKFDVKSIIDWELSELHGFPLLDVLYLITYNIYITYGDDFVSIFSNLLADKVNSIYLDMIAEYLLKFEITQNQKKILLGIYFIHHFSKRVDIDYSDEIYLKKIEETLIIVCKILNGDKV